MRFHIDTLIAGILDYAQKLWHLPPTLVMSNLQMQQIDGGPATLGNLDRFGDGLKNLFTLAASVLA